MALSGRVKKGSTLPYYCAIHTWMQGKIKVK